MARATGELPTTSTWVGLGAVTLSRRASGRDVALCTSTVPMISRKVSDTRVWAATGSFSSMRSANRADTAAATMPRGAIQASSARSGQCVVPPSVDSSTASGRTTSIAAASTSRPVPSSGRPGHCRRAASTMKSIEMISVERCSLNERMCSTSRPRMFASTMPMTVTASRPLSWASRLLAA